jgi:hypothetical protein
MVFDSALFTRTLSQSLQALLAVAFCAAWARETGRRPLVVAIRHGLIIALPATLFGAWLFEQTQHQALWEATFATCTLVGAAAFAVAVWRDRSLEQRSSADIRSIPVAFAAVLVAAIAIAVARQTSEIGVTFHAAIGVRSVGALVTMSAAIACAVCASSAWVWCARRLSLAALLKASRIFAVLFVAQVALYAFHEAAEARMLPLSDVFHAATEPYGPDSQFGMYVSVLLLIIPVIAASAASISERITDPVTNFIVLGTLPALCLAVLASGAVMQPTTAAPATSSQPTAPVARDAKTLAQLPHVLFRNTRRNADRGHVAIAPLDAPDTERASIELRCARVSFGADRGICIAERPDAKDCYDAVVFDSDFAPLFRVPHEGFPSRTRTSRDGRYGATTMFLAGESHGYAGVDFSTRTRLFDMRRGTEIADLEEFTTIRDGKRIKAPDFNFWGVTFTAADSNVFYATLHTAKSNLLVRGDIAARTVTVIHDNVECPSASPDGRHIAFKRLDGPLAGEWKLHVLDLATMADRPIASAYYFVDDQVEWLDNLHILYALPHMGTADVWVASIDEGEPAGVFLHDAESPIVVRDSSASVVTTH